MLRGHSADLIRGVFNPFFRRNLTAVSVRYSEENDRKKVEGVFSWLKDIFKSDVRVQGDATAWRSSVNFQLEDVLRDSPKKSVRNTQSSSSSDVARKDDRSDHKINSSSTRSISYFDHQLRTRSLLFVNERMDLQIRGVASCSPRNTKPPIREPNMPERQGRKDDKEKKKKKKPVIRVDTSENCPDTVSVEAMDNHLDNSDVNFRYQWGTKIPQEAVGATQDFDKGQAWIKGTNPTGFYVSSTCDSEEVHNENDLGLTMTSTESDKDDTQPEKSQDSSNTSKTEEAITRLESAKRYLKTKPKVAKEETAVDEDYNIPPEMDFDAEINAWKDLVSKSKVPIDADATEYSAQEQRQIDLLSIRPEPPQPKLDVQAIPSADTEIMKEAEEEADMSKDMKIHLKGMDGKRITDVHKIDTKKLHTFPVCHSRLNDNDSFMIRSKSRNSTWTLMSMNRLSIRNAVAFSSSSDGSWVRVDDTKDAKASKALPIGDPTNPDSRVPNAETENIVEETASREHQQLLRNKENYQEHQPEMDAEFADSLNAISEREIEISLQRPRQDDQEINDSSVNLSSQRDAIKLETEDQHLRSRYDDYQQQRQPNHFTEYEDDFYSGYESMSLDSASEKSSREERRGDKQSADWTDHDASENEARKLAVHENNYIRDGNYVKVPGDPYPYSKKYFDKWKMSKEDINIGTTFIENQEHLDSDSVIADSTSRHMDTLPSTRNMSQDVYISRDVTRGKGVPK